MYFSILRLHGTIFNVNISRNSVALQIVPCNITFNFNKAIWF